LFRRFLVLILVLGTFLMTACPLTLLGVNGAMTGTSRQPLIGHDRHFASMIEVVPATFPLPTATPTPRPAPAANPALLALREQLTAAISASGMNAAVAVADLQTGEAIDVNGDTARHAGCTANWFVLLSVVMDVQNGLYPEGLVGSLISRTIYGSNPVTARDLLIQTGGGSEEGGVLKVRRLLASFGLTHSTFDHPPGYSEEYTTDGSPNVLTANDVTRALAAFYRDEVVTRQWRDYLLEKMTNVKPGLQYLIPAGVGENARVSHKNGFTWMPGGWVDNDIGIVVFDTGGGPRAYAIAFYTQDVPCEYADVPLGQQVSQLVWRYFATKYP
jgi:beta-lactamase class A